MVKHILRGRLLASFQDLEHEGGDTRSQGGIKDNDIKIKIQDHWRVNDHSNEFPRTRLQVSRKVHLNDHPLGGDLMEMIRLSDFMTKSSSTSLNFLLEETNTFENSLLEFKTFCFDLEEISSGSTTTRFDISLPDYEAFYDDQVKEISSGSTTTRFDISLPDYEAFYDDQVKEISSGSTTTHSDFFLYDLFIFDLSINPLPPVDRSDFYEFANELAHIISPPEYDCFCFKNEPNSRDFTMDVVEDIFPTRKLRVHVHNALSTHPTLQLNLYFILSSEYLFAYVVWIFLPFLSYSVAPRYLLSFGNEDAIFDLGISSYHICSFMPDVSHRIGTFIKFNVYPKHLNERDDENATNPPQVPPTPQAPHTLLTIKLPIVKKGEYGIWAMFQSLLSQLEIHGASVSTKDAYQKFLRSLPSSCSQVSLIMRTKPGVDTLSFYDLYKNLRVFEFNVKGSTASSCNIQNMMFVSSDNTSSTNEVDEFDLEEMDLKWQVAMIPTRLKKFYKKTGRKLHFDAKEPVVFDNNKVECFNCHNTGDIEDSHVNDRFIKVEGMHAVPPLMTRNYMPLKSDFGIDESKFTYGPKQSKNSESNAKINDLSSCEPNFSVETLESVPKPFESKPKAVSKPKVWSDAPIIEEYELDSNDEYVFKATVEQEKPSCACINTIKHVKTPRQTVKDQDTCSQNPKVHKRDWTGLMSKRLGIIMAGENIDNLTMEQYFTLTRGNHAPGVVKPEIEGSVNFEIKSPFMCELREDTFTVMLRDFPITLTGATKRWVDRLTLGTINTWDLLKRPLSKGNVHHLRLLNNLKTFATSSKREKRHCTKLGKDLGSSISIMPFSMYKHLEMGKLEPINMVIDVGIKGLQGVIDVQVGATTTMTAKLPILNPGEYELWLIRIEQYFLMADYSLWEVIKNGNKVLTKPVGLSKQTYEPTTAEEKHDRRNEMKARGTLLMALPNKDQLKFHSYQDAKLLMEAIEKRYRGNKESKKVRRALLKQQYENFTASSLETLDQTFDRLKKLINTTASGVSTAHTQGTTVNSTSVDNLSDAMICGFLASQPNTPQLAKEDLEQIDPDDLESLDMNGRRIGFDKTKVECFNCHKMATLQENVKLQGIKTTESYQAEEETPTNYAFMALTSSGSSSSSDSEGYHKVPPPFTGNYMPLKRDLRLIDEHFESESVDVSTVSSSADKTVKTVDITHKGVLSTEEPKSIMKNNFGPPIIEDWHSDDDSGDELSPIVEDKTVKPSVEKIESIKTPREIIQVYNGLDPQKSLTLLFYVHGNPQQKKYKEKGVIDSGCSRRLGHINFKTMNKLVKGNLIRGLPSKIFQNDNSFVACQEGKQHKASYKAKLMNTISKPLHMLHMDLFGATNVKSLMKKSYCLVITNDFSRFSWVFFLATKSETSGILKTFITGIENQLDYKVKVSWSDNGTEFKNSVMTQFCDDKGIKKECSVARTPQQNKVAERRNRTLIEATRTMLVDSKLPTTFLAESVNTACYVLSRTLVTKPHNKTPYELIRRRSPLIDFMKPFGYPVTILNTRDNLGKFKGKADEGYFAGYSVASTNAFKEYSFERFSLFKNAFSLPHVHMVTPIDDTGIFGNTYDDDVLKKEVDMNNVDSSYAIPEATKFLKDHPQEQVIGTSTPMEFNKPLIKDEEAKDVDVHLYRSMIGSLMYLTTSRPDITFAVCACARLVIAKDGRCFVDTSKVTTGKTLLSTVGQRVITPLFDTMMVQAAANMGDTPVETHQTPIVDQPSTSKPQKKQKPRRKQRKEVEVSHDKSEDEDHVPIPSSDPLPSGEDSYTLNELMVSCTSLQEHVFDLQEVKDAQSKEIAGLKKKVSKMIEEIDQDDKIALNADTQGRKNDDEMFRVDDLSGEEVVLDTTTGEHEEQIIEDVSIAESVTTAGEVVTTIADKVSVAPTTDVTEDDITMAQALAALKSTKPNVMVQDQEVSTTVPAGATIVTTVVPTQRAQEYVRQLKAKEQEAARLSKAQQDKETNIPWDNIQDKMEADSLLAERLQAREREEFSEGMSYNEIKKLFDREMRKVNEFIAMDSKAQKSSGKEAQESSTKRITESLKSEISKKQKVDKNVEPVIDDTKELKKCMEIVPDDGDEVLIKATPLSSRSSSIIDYKTHKEGKKTYFNIIRADSTSQVYQTFEKMFKNFNREDIEVLWGMVKDRFKKEKPMDEMDNLLFRTLKTMFEHH
uniref:Putative ribonuclease H-like domain-containing protein n=1 Tax=Tanacetum cinerariifolium TaxID=118510 RepID=A0A6L2KLZ0_TANCI|nr:putative ribonuclease H-like domain-containing protein [Tanacetum cinerariifolium]